METPVPVSTETGAGLNGSRRRRSLSTGSNPASAHFFQRCHYVSTSRILKYPEARMIPAPWPANQETESAHSAHALAPGTGGAAREGIGPWQLFILSCLPMG